MRLFAFLLPLLLILALPQPAGAQEGPTPPRFNDPATTACKSVLDCTWVEPPCGLPAAINRDHYISAAAWYARIKPLMKCADWLKPPVVTGLTCEKQRCAVSTATEAAKQPAQISDGHYCDKDEECVVVIGDCCTKSFYNDQSAGRAAAEIEYNKRLAHCHRPDTRTVHRLRCEKHRCTADYEVPFETTNRRLHPWDICGFEDPVPDGQRVANPHPGPFPGSPLKNMKHLPPGIRDGTDGLGSKALAPAGTDSTP